MSLDPNDPRPPYVQVASVLRAAILTGSIPPGDRLPSGPELSQRYGVARQTVQNAIKVLRDEGLIVSRQGSGVFVRDRTDQTVSLRPHIERAFESRVVTIDFAGFSGETLNGALESPFDKIRSGRLTPESISLRILVPDTSQPMGLPCLAEDLRDEPRLRARMRRIMLRHTLAIGDALEQLTRMELVKKASVETRVYTGVPLFKLYLINNEEAFFGFYPVTRRTIIDSGDEVDTYDVTSKDSMLFHHAVTGTAALADAQYVEQARAWFDSMWTSLGRPFTP
jgi:DNA-binding transcriptional regulator YhcF (GntR family)